MSDRPRFGPAGIPYVFKLTKEPISELPNFLQAENLGALEYGAVRWGQKPQISREEAEKLGTNAEKHDVWLSVHGSYYINLTGNEEIVAASKRRLLACATAAQWMKAHTLTFHTGYFTQRQSHRSDLQNCVKNLKEVVEKIQQTGIKTRLGPETSGKLSQLGTLDEVLAICENVEQTQPVIDWAHLHARQRGSLRDTSDFQQVVEKIEKRLGTRAAKNLHCHFSLVEYTFRGERRHHSLGTPGYGPRFEPLAEVIASQNLSPVIISESPLLDEDAKKMRDIVHQKMGELAILR
ncbi:MAG: TIM barrel protein [Candidatus Bathyarchaeia archaeon]